MIISAISAFTIYYFFYWSYRPPPIPLQTNSITLEWQNNNLPLLSCANCTEYEFYHIPLNLSFYNNTITQYQEVNVSSHGGAISTNLARGLWYVAVSYQKAVPFGVNGNIVGTTIGLTLHPQNGSSVDIGVGPTTALVAETTSIEWQTVGNDYPTVSLVYTNGTSFPHPYPDRTLYVQSETITNDEITNAIWHEQELGLLLVLPVFAAIDGIVLAFYQHFGPKD